MLSLVVKNVRYKYMYILGCAILVFVTLIKVEKYSLFDAFHVFFGGYPLWRPISVMSVGIYFALLQYINTDVLLLFFRKDSYISIRYKDKTILFLKFLIYLVVLNFLFILTVVMAFLLVAFLYQYNIQLLELVEISLRGLLCSFFFSIIQTLFFQKWNMEKTFMLMTGISVLTAMLSRFPLEIITVCPYELEGVPLVVQIVLSNVYIGIVIVRLFKIYQKRELGNNEN